MSPDDVKNLVGNALLRASNFMRVDLQIHSDESDDFPQSRDFGGVRFEVSDQDITPVPSPSFLNAACERQLDLIAITDHMKSRKSCEIASLSQERKGGVVALPAIEAAVSLSQISSSGKDAVHLLCVFREGKSPEDIEKIFHGAYGLKDYEDRAVSDAIQIDLRQFVNNIHAQDGICIASHVNAEKGLRRVFFTVSEINYLMVKKDRESLERQKGGNEWTAEKDSHLQDLRQQEKQLANQIQDYYLQFLVDAGVDAVQIQNSTEGQFYRGEHCERLGIQPIAAVLTSDAHCLSAIGYEKKITFVKMTRACWEDLRLALKDPEVRIRYADTVGTRVFPKIKGMVLVTVDGFFKGTTHPGRAAPEVIGFADNLTCLIGGRGAGKSAAIDALRFVFKDRQEVELLPEHLRADIYGRLEHALKDTTILLLLEAEDGEEIVVSSFYAGWEKRSYESRFLNGEDAGVNLAASSKYRAEIYGWNEIETLGTDSKKQLSLLDRFIPTLRQIVEDLHEKKNQLRTNRLRIADSAKRLEQLIPTVKDFNEAKSSLDKINSPEMQSIFSEIDKILEDEKALASASQDLTGARGVFASEYNLRAELEKAAAKLPDALIRERVFGKADSLIDEAARAHSNLLAVLKRMGEALEAETRMAKQAETHAVTKLSTAVGGDAKNLSNLDKRRARKSRFDELAGQKEKVAKAREQLLRDLAARDALIAEYEKLQAERSRVRSATKDEINARLSAAITHGPKIAIGFTPLGNREEMQRRLGTAAAGPATAKESGILRNVGLKYMERRVAEIISSKFSPSQFASAILNGKEGDLVSTHPDGKDALSLEDCKRIFAHLNPRNVEFDEEHFYTEKLQTMLEMQEIETDDHPEITLDGQPITELSPGQRCSALVPIILLQGNHPLIIDQPEDNLDNRLVFDLVVEILRNLKESRQIIVATHNPNIPVSGDAEQIVVFKSLGRKTGQVEVQGSIDDPIVIQAVKDIMEGGEQAFLTRAKKYRYELSS